MASESEIELLGHFAEDLRRLPKLLNAATTEEGRAAFNDLKRSLDHRTPAMKRAVERTGVNFRVDLRPIEGVARSIDVLDAWNGRDDIRVAAITVIQRAIGAYESGTLPASSESAGRSDPVERVRHVLEKLPRVARALRDRYDGRETLEMNDEYDVQDLLRVLLAIHFDDIRKEEWTPSYAGKCARMDLLLKPEQLVIEVKITKPGRAEKQIGDELIVDIARYATHPACKTLMCFVFDPMFQIGNPAMLEHDLSKDDAMKVVVIIAPKH